MEAGAAAAAAAAAAAGSSSSTAKVNLIKQIRSHEIALAELNSISSSSRSVYQKNGNIFFHTTIQNAVASEQKQLDSTKSMLENLNTS